LLDFDFDLFPNHKFTNKQTLFIKNNYAYSPYTISKLLIPGLDQKTMKVLSRIFSRNNCCSLSVPYTILLCSSRLDLSRPESRKREERRKKERKKEKKVPFIVATYVYASSQGQRTRSVRTNFTTHTTVFLEQASPVKNK
jgi:hypothetical protein